MITTRWLYTLATAIVVMLPLQAHAQTVVEIGTIASVADNSATTWGMSGMEMVKVSRSIGSETPIMRTMKWDARTVEILSRTQAPALRASDIKRVSKGGRELVVVRQFLLMEVMPEDARAAGMSKSALAEKWAEAVRQVLPKVAPMPNRFGA